MANDHNGNTLSVGQSIWIPLTITSISFTGQITGTTGFSGLSGTYSGTSVVNVPSPDTHVNKPSNFPDQP